MRGMRAEEQDWAETRWRNMGGEHIAYILERVGVNNSGRFRDVSCA